MNINGTNGLACLTKVERDPAKASRFETSFASDFNWKLVISSCSYCLDDCCYLLLKITFHCLDT